MQAAQWGRQSWARSLARGAPRPAPLVSAALGDEIDGAIAETTARALGLAPQRVSDTAATVASLLERGKIVAICQGRFGAAPPGPAAGVDPALLTGGLSYVAPSVYTLF